MGNQTLTLNGGTVDFGPAEGLLQVSNANITANSTLIGTGGLTTVETTAGTVTLNAANNYTGATTLNGTAGSVAVGNVSAFGNGPVTLKSGTLASNIGSLVLANAFKLNDSVAVVAASNRIFFTGPITVSGNNQIQVSTPAFFSGVVGGTGSINMLSGSALVMQNANNTYSGGTNIGGGNVQVNASDTFNAGVIVRGPLGTGPINLTGGVLQNANTGLTDYAVNSITLHNNIMLANANTTIGGPAASTTGNAGGGGDILLAGQVTVLGNNNTVSVVPGINFTIAGPVQFNGALTKANTGPMLLSSANSLAGGVNVTGGSLIVGNDSRSARASSRSPAGQHRTMASRHTPSATPSRGSPARIRSMRSIPTPCSRSAAIVGSGN